MSDRFCSSALGPRFYAVMHRLIGSVERLAKAIEKANLLKEQELARSGDKTDSEPEQNFEKKMDMGV